MSTALTTLTSKLAARFDMGDSAELIDTLKATAFKSQVQVSDAQMTALLIVANQYGLNPWTKEIYAFPDKGGIVPVVGVDGWSRIVNEHPQFDGMDFEQDDSACTCVIYRKDRGRPIKVTEYMTECRRSNAGPWQSHPKRMLRHKAFIQCARLAFGFGGIVDPDEAERIAEGTVNPLTGEIEREEPPKQLDAYPADLFAKKTDGWRQQVQSGDRTPDDIINMVSTRYSLTEDQKKAIRDFAVIDAEFESVDDFVRDMEAAQ